MFLKHIFLLLFELFSKLSHQHLFSYFLKGENTCGNFVDYKSATTNPNCWYNPDVEMKTPELIQKYVGRMESYNVTTEDGYILSVFRLPRDNPKGVLFLQHTMFSDSRIYMSQGSDSTAFLLWRAGYDVWLGNQRGTFHSMHHITLSPMMYEYWNFSYHEIGQYDLSSMLRLVYNKTNSKIWYFGHSLGTTTGLIYASMKPDEAHRLVETFMLAGTSAYYMHATSYLATISPYFEPFLTQLAELLEAGHLVILPETTLLLSRFLLRAFPSQLWILNLSLCMALGWTPEEADPTFFNFDMGQNLRDSSVKLSLHYLQMMRVKDRFQMFDYGPEGNRRLYGSDRPKLYPVENISVPVFLISSSQDTLTSLGDSDYLYNRKLSPPAKIYKPLYITGFNHADYQYGKHRKERLVGNLLKFLDSARRRKK